MELMRSPCEAAIAFSQHSVYKNRRLEHFTLQIFLCVCLKMHLMFLEILRGKIRQTLKRNQPPDAARRLTGHLLHRIIFVIFIFEPCT